MSAKEERKTISIIVKILLLLSVPIIFALVLMHFVPITTIFFKKELLVSYLSDLAGFAPIIYIFLQATTVLIVPIPSVILATAAGTVFNFWQAAVYTTIAWSIGTTTNFFIARIGGRPLMKRMMSSKELDKVDKFADTIGWKVIFISWFIPGGTADMTGYAAGLSKMKYSKYILPALTSASILSILTSAAGSAIKISPVLTVMFYVGAILGVILGAKIILLFILIKKVIVHTVARLYKK